jgi:hypothetical protein
MVANKQQNPTFVSWLIPKKSGKAPLETMVEFIAIRLVSVRVYSLVNQRYV